MLLQINMLNKVLLVFPMLIDTASQLGSGSQPDRYQAQHLSLTSFYSTDILLIMLSASELLLPTVGLLYCTEVGPHCLSYSLMLFSSWVYLSGSS